MSKYKLLLVALIFSSATLAQKASPPIMGWSSWNHFHVKIDEKMIREQADAMINTGLYTVGCRFINVH